MVEALSRIFPYNPRNISRAGAILGNITKTHIAANHYVKLIKQYFVCYTQFA